MAPQPGQIRVLIRLRRFVVMSQKYGLALTNSFLSASPTTNVVDLRKEISAVAFRHSSHLTV